MEHRHGWLSGWMRTPLVILLLIIFSCPTDGAFAKATPKKSKGKAAASKAKKSGGGGGGGFGAAKTPPKLPSVGDDALDAAIAARCDALKSQKLKNGQLWLELGSILVKANEYAEAERVFRAGASHVPDNEMLSAAALTLGGDSATYCREVSKDVAPPPHAIDDSGFEGFEAPPEEILGLDQADRAVVWSEGKTSLVDRGAVFKSTTPLLDPADCAWVIEQVEAHAAVHGWTKDRHVEAPTTDIPVSAVPAIREWFDEALATRLFPMLHSRFPSAIRNPSELRVLDAFVVRYDAREQASLPTHQVCASRQISRESRQISREYRQRSTHGLLTRSLSHLPRSMTFHGLSTFAAS